MSERDGIGDMPPEEFRRYGHQLVDWVADYFATPERYPVLSRSAPGELKSTLPASAPEHGEPMDAIIRDFERLIVPGLTHWNHPAFFAYFAITGSAPGVLAEILSAGLNVNAMLWRTSPAATELEETVLEWLAKLVGLPADFEGVIYDTASISSLVAIAAAREALHRDIRERGLAGRSDLPQLRLYCSEQSHSSIEKAAIILGIGQGSVRKIGTDTQFRMDADALEKAIDEDEQRGYAPFCVVATIGTTATTSIDPVRRIAEICRRHTLWLHIDAAYGGAAAILPEMRWIMDGVDGADSFVVNPHKWLFTPIDCSALYSRRLGLVADAFSLIPPYLRTPEDDDVRNYMNYGPQLGRRFRALKLWFVLRSFGRTGLVEQLREHIRLAVQMETWVSDDPDWEMIAPRTFSTLCFRAHPAGIEPDATDRLNEYIEQYVNASGEAFLAHTTLSGVTVLRLAIGNLRTEERHVRRVWELLQEGYLLGREQTQSTGT